MTERVTGPLEEKKNAASHQHANDRVTWKTRQEIIQMVRGNDVISRTEVRACQPVLASAAELSRQWHQSGGKAKSKKKKCKPAVATLIKSTTNTLAARDHFTNHTPVFRSPIHTENLLGFTTVISHHHSPARTRSDRKEPKQKPRNY